MTRSEFLQHAKAEFGFRGKREAAGFLGYIDTFLEKLPRDETYLRYLEQILMSEYFDSRRRSQDAYRPYLSCG